ncbi:TPA: tail fiber assembly protein [Enterobacter cloacae]|nr:tail fiber assembly protein [Enterobacter cloacae]
MKNFKNFSKYTPELDGKNSDLLALGISFLKDENGRDWYELQESFEQNTLKIIYDHDGVVRSINNDVSALWPVDMSVAEVELNDLPEGFDINGLWMFFGGNIIPVPVDYVANAIEKKQILMNEAMAVIAPLEDAAEFGISTEKEATLLVEWKKYRVLLNRVDTSKAPEIEWPEVPENVA